MKKTLTILCFIMGCISYSQDVVAVENFLNNLPDYTTMKYYADINRVLDKFLGSWKYQNASQNPTEHIEVVFFKGNVEYPGANYSRDIIDARVKYSKNGQVIFNTLNSNEIMYDIYGSSFLNPQNTNKIRLLYSEPDAPGAKYRAWLYLEFMPGTPAQLKWHMEWQALDENIDPPKMPENMIFTKVN
ncbi:DUF6705 family protein [Flavobacterium psychrotrophum]|uniref:DUF6705 family protein n=1 Tax=Flavobacterium psychrotrophum TaxID=2294119 RepID=UPI0013C4FC2F|nr:DUF6705 family protein [Flavobacterium psychrotrophum]